MRKDPIDSSVVQVSLKNKPEHLARLGRIAACLADSAGIADCETERVALSLAEHSVLCSPDVTVCVEFRISPRSFIAEIADAGNARLMFRIVRRARRSRMRSRLRMRVAI